MTATSGPVVEAGLAGLRSNRAVVIPGIVNKLGAQGHRFLPRGLLRKVTGLVKA
jgi:short-subunit dehydrogenase